jgi:uncharacterized protein YigE (DUF2233 family)
MRDSRLKPWVMQGRHQPPAWCSGELLHTDGRPRAVGRLACKDGTGWNLRSMRNMLWTAIIAVVAAVAIAAWWLSRHAPPPSDTRMPAESASLPRICREEMFEGSAYIVCAVNPKQYAIDLYLTRPDGKPYERLDRLAADHPFLFAMNAGMYHEDFSPVGLFVEAGRAVTPLNEGDAPGNFFMKPNGVFYVDAAGNAGVMETAAYAAAAVSPRIATQSGPMLVIDGNIHPMFEPDGESRFIRNGVGVRDPHTVLFAVSRTPVSLGSFARLFRDELGCPNALFFDGAVSALHDGKKYLIGGDSPAGPIVAISEKPVQ